MINKNICKNSKTLYCSIVIVMLFTMFLICIIMKITPFGNNTFAMMDANIQYLDFFSFFKDVLNGDESILYSFKKTLGGTNIAVFGYYLSSPLNLLIVLFQKDQLEVFFTLLVSLKLTLAALSCGIFLRHRFQSLRIYTTLLLSISYGLMQYNFAQSSNLMWLDGVYMLPLIMLGISILTQKGKTTLLSLTVGLSILFNWYTGAINCLFSVLWFLYELSLLIFFDGQSITKYFHYIWKYVYSMILGVLLSSVLFLPVVLAMLGGRAGIDWNSLVESYTFGNFLATIQKSSIGSVSTYGSVSLYCGSIPLAGIISYFLSKVTDKKEKRIHLFFIFVILSLFYIPVLIFLFCLLKDVTSYWYRYSYIGIFFLITVAANFFSISHAKEEKGILVKSAMIFSAVLLVLDYLHPLGKTNYTFITIFFLITSAKMYDMHVYSQKRKTLISIILLSLVICELIFNAKSLNYTIDQSSEYTAYVKAAEKQFDELKKQDSDFYRINQTKTRNMTDHNLTANYNESLAFGYNSISGYTSDPDNISINFLNRLGYNICGDNMNIVNTSILAADSLLSVKYILSDYDINGLKKLNSLGKYNGKYTYYNPYALPVAFTYHTSDLITDEYESNPFLYQNKLYSMLLGKTVELYKPLEYERTISENSVLYDIRLPEQDNAAYGYCDITDWGGGNIYINNTYVSGYNMWLAPRLFYIHPEGNSSGAMVKITKDSISNFISGDEFYFLDLSTFKKVVQELSTRKADALEIRDGFVTCSVSQAKPGENLYLSIPYDTGWKLQLNGQDISPSLVGNCMISIPLVEGENEISLSYHVKGLLSGFIISIFTFSTIAFIYFCEKSLLRYNGHVPVEHTMTEKHLE